MASLTGSVSGSGADEAGLSLFLVDADAKGLARRAFPAIDGGAGFMERKQSIPVARQHVKNRTRRNESEGFCKPHNRQYKRVLLVYSPKLFCQVHRVFLTQLHRQRE